MAVMDIQPMPASDHRVVVAAAGPLDLATAPQLAEALAKAQQGDASQIVVDLSAVDFLDSTGIGVLVRAARNASSNGATLYLEGARGAVAQVLKLAGVDSYLRPPPKADAEANTG